jgi:hypothetical protein
MGKNYRMGKNYHMMKNKYKILCGVSKAQMKVYFKRAKLKMKVLAMNQDYTARKREVEKAICFKDH